MKAFVMSSYLLLAVVIPGLAPDSTDSLLIYEGVSYPLYPATIASKPAIPSPLATADGAEYVVGLTEAGKYTIFRVTVENRATLEEVWFTQGRQLVVDTADFPTLAGTGLHSEEELTRTQAITGRSVQQITSISHPDQYSGEGFLARDESILSVLTGDNRLVQALGLTHPDLAKPLFHVCNIIQAVMSDSVHVKRGDQQAILYNGRTINLTFQGAKGWQESIFDDEILGYWEIEIWRDLDQDELAFLAEQYSNLTVKSRAQLAGRLSFTHTGDMVPFYIMRYGFYEGHTGYRADPIAIASIFGLRTIQDINEVFGAGLQAALANHHKPESPVHGRSHEHR